MTGSFSVVTDNRYRAVHVNEEPWDQGMWVGSASVSYNSNHFAGVANVNLDYVAIG